MRSTIFLFSWWIKALVQKIIYGTNKKLNHCSTQGENADEKIHDWTCESKIGVTLISRGESDKIV